MLNQRFPDAKDFATPLLGYDIVHIIIIHYHSQLLSTSAL